jgi:hypothetical protein
MMTLLTALVFAILAAHPVCMLLIHRALCRWGSRAHGRPPQGRALGAAALTSALFLLLVSAASWNDEHFVAIFLYSALLCSCASGVYFVMFCNTESGRRYHILKLLLTREHLERGEIRAAYSAQYIVDKRLDRLVQWGALRLERGRFVIHKRRFLLTSLLFYGWSRLLGYRWFPPLTPTGKNHRQESKGPASEADESSPFERKMAA